MEIYFNLLFDYEILWSKQINEPVYDGIMRREKMRSKIRDFSRSLFIAI